MHIRIDYRNGGKRHVAYCSEYHKGKAKNPKCHSPHIMDADLLMQTITEVLKKIEDYSISNRAEFEALVKKNLAMQQTDQTKKQQKRIPQITIRLEQMLMYGKEASNRKQEIDRQHYTCLLYTSKTLPYPGYPTDMQPQIGVALALAKGTSTITESILDRKSVV